MKCIVCVYMRISNNWKREILGSEIGQQFTLPFRSLCGNGLSFSTRKMVKFFRYSYCFPQNKRSLRKDTHVSKISCEYSNLLSKYMSVYCSSNLTSGTGVTSCVTVSHLSLMKLRPSLRKALSRTFKKCPGAGWWLWFQALEESWLEGGDMSETPEENQH